MNRKEKHLAVENLRQVFSTASIVVVGQNTGLNAEKTTALRKSVRQSSGVTLVTKNTLAKLSAKGSEYESLTPLLKGATLLMYSTTDPVALAKSVVSFAKENQALELKGGAMGSKSLDQNTLKALAELPSLDQLRAKIIGVIQAPATKIARVAVAPAQQIARVLKAYSEL